MGVKTTGPDRKATNSEVLQFIREHSMPIVTAKHITERFGVTRAAANKWLDDLVEQNEIEQFRVGASAKVYWIAEN